MYLMRICNETTHGVGMRDVWPTHQNKILGSRSANTCSHVFTVPPLHMLIMTDESLTTMSTECPRVIPPRHSCQWVGIVLVAP